MEYSAFQRLSENEKQILRTLFLWASETSCLYKTIIFSNRISDTATEVGIKDRFLHGTEENQHEIDNQMCDELERNAEKVFWLELEIIC